MNKKKCGAKTRAGTPCKKWAMPNGRCRNHGGVSTGRPIITGRYSVKHRESLQTKMQEYLSDPEPGNLIHELAMQRALFQDYMDKITELPINIEAREHALDILEAIGKMVERISRILNQTALTQAEIQFLRARLFDLIVKYIDDPQKRLDFISDLRTAIEGDSDSIRSAAPAITADITVSEVADVSG